MEPNGILSVFVDESGRFLHPDSESRFYIIGMVFHDQSADISKAVKDFDRSIYDLGLDPNAFVFHAGPLVRREKGTVPALALAHACFALTRDHESVVAQQSLTRLECADSPFGLMPCGIAEANQRIRPSGLSRHPDTKGRLRATRKFTKSGLPTDFP